MTAERIKMLRALAESQQPHRSAKIILECLEEIETLTNLYSIALDAAYKGFPRKAQALGKLKRLAECQSTRS